MASVRKLDPNDAKSPWVVEYTDAAGKRRRKTPKSGLKKDADRLRQQIEREIGDGVHVADRETVPLKHAIETFLNACERRVKLKDGMTRGCFFMYSMALKRVLKDGIAYCPVKELTVPVMQKFFDELGKSIGPKSIIHTLNVLKLVLDRAMQEGWCKSNMLRGRSRDRGVRVPAVQRNTSIPSEEVLGKLLATAGTRLPGEGAHARLVRIALINLVLHDGLRPGEVAGLTWENVDIEREVIRVRQAVSRYDGVKGPKSRAGIREVTLLPHVRDALLDLKNSPAKRETSENYVFGSKYSNPISPHNLSETYWRPLARACGLYNPETRKWKYRLYDLRHAAASLRIRHGLSPLHIKTFMGHAKVTTTLDIYGHLFPEDQAAKQAAIEIATRLARLPADQSAQLDAT